MSNILTDPTRSRLIDKKDPKFIIDKFKNPESITVAQCANKINQILVALKVAGLIHYK
jgi:hypothetical protein